MYIYFRGVIMSVLESCRCSCSRVGSNSVVDRRLSFIRTGINTADRRRRRRRSI